MKKIPTYAYFILIGVILLAFAIPWFISLRSHAQGEKINAEIQTVMEAQFENDDAYQCEIVFTTDCTESNVVNGVEDDSVYPDDIPIWIEEHYIVTASKTAKTAKIEHTETISDTKDSEETTKTYTDQIYYLAIVDDAVQIYSPENGTYTMQSYQNDGLADAISVLLFPTDISYLNDGTFVQSYTVTDAYGYPRYSAQRSVPAENFYKPFEILCGDNDENTELEDLSINFNWNDQSELPEDIYRYGISMNDVTSLYAYAYEAWTGTAYENDLSINGYSYQQSTEINFYDGWDEVETFELPSV